MRYAEGHHLLPGDLEQTLEFVPADISEHQQVAPDTEGGCEVQWPACHAIHLAGDREQRLIDGLGAAVDIEFAQRVDRHQRDTERPSLPSPEAEQRPQAILARSPTVEPGECVVLAGVSVHTLAQKRETLAEFLPVTGRQADHVRSQEEQPALGQLGAVAPRRDHGHDPDQRQRQGRRRSLGEPQPEQEIDADGDEHEAGVGGQRLPSDPIEQTHENIAAAEHQDCADDDTRGETAEAGTAQEEPGADQHRHLHAETNDHPEAHRVVAELGKIMERERDHDAADRKDDLPAGVRQLAHALLLELLFEHRREAQPSRVALGNSKCVSRLALAGRLPHRLHSPGGGRD